MYYWSIYWHLSWKSASGGRYKDSKTVGNGAPDTPDRGGFKKNGNKIKVEKEKAEGDKIKKRNTSSKREAATCV